MIPKIPLIETRLRQINPRLMELVQLELSGRISPKRKAELDALCNALETFQDFEPDPAFVASQSSRKGVSTEGFNPGQRGEEK